MVVCSQETHSLKHTLTLERIGGFAAPVQSAVIETGGVDCCCYPDTRLMSKHWKTEASELFGKELGCQTRSNSLLRVIARTCNDLSPNPRGLDQILWGHRLLALASRCSDSLERIWLLLPWKTKGKLMIRK